MLESADAGVGIRAAGADSGRVVIHVVTHMHRDHVGGLAAAGGLAEALQHPALLPAGVGVQVIDVDLDARPEGLPGEREALRGEAVVAVAEQAVPARPGRSRQAAS